ncbi:Urotensin-2 receptor [Branchiostoma belcheri]|nr:Urotensin-2 receptor [Branchiostoma belcheri]
MNFDRGGSGRFPLSTYEKECGKVKHTELPADQPPAVVPCTTVCRPRATEMDMGTKTLCSAWSTVQGGRSRADVRVLPRLGPVVDKNLLHHACGEDEVVQMSGCYPVWSEQEIKITTLLLLGFTKQKCGEDEVVQMSGCYPVWSEQEIKITTLLLLGFTKQKCGEDEVVQMSGCYPVWSEQEIKIYFTTLFIIVCGEDGAVQMSGCYPVWSEQEIKIYFTTLFIIVVSTLLAYLLTYSTVCGEDGAVQMSGCYPVWSEQEIKIYFTTLFAVAFVIPGVVLCAFYLRMLCKYWLPAGRPIGEVTSRATESRKKVAKMVSLILVVFWLCYLPFCNVCRSVAKMVSLMLVVFWLCYLPFCTVCRSVAKMVSLILVVFWLCYLPFWILQMLMFHGYVANYYLRFVLQNLSYINACANPFLYTLLSDKYKTILKGILRMGGAPSHPVVHRTMTTHSSIELNSMRRARDGHVMDRSSSHVTSTHNPSPMFGTPHFRRTFYTIRERSSSEENDPMNVRA